MAYKTLIFGTDDIYKELKPFYDEQIQRGTLEIVAYAILENAEIHCIDLDGNLRSGVIECDIVIVSSHNDFYNRMKFLEAQGVPCNRIIDGTIFQVRNLDFPRLLKEGVAYGVFDKDFFSDVTFSVYPRIYANQGTVVKFGTKSYIGGAHIDGGGLISLGKFSSLSWSLLFNMGQNGDHNYRNVTNYGLTHLDWQTSAEFYPPYGVCKILIGNDVWIGRGCNLKSANPDKPLIIGDGAVVASDSVVVKDVPPYAIVGGNPAKIIKYRFPPDVIESLLRIKWWNWSLEKIHDNFQYFNDIEKFISLHDA